MHYNAFNPLNGDKLSQVMNDALGGLAGATQNDDKSLVALADFGDNPGALSAFTHVPDDLAPGAPLVVVLHGCTQNAAGFDRGSGWSMLADRHGFALLFPEQSRSNNPNLCFNWFQPKDTARGKGEAASIAAMIDAMITQHGIDPSRVHITGLSAGGAMSSAMLAAYPERFASGAIIAGLAYGLARNVPQALDAMAGRQAVDADGLAAHVRAASDHAGPWPRIAVWQGDADHTVVPANGALVAAQWAGVQGLDEAPATSKRIGPHRRTVWTDASGEERIELYEVSGMGHGVPLRPGTGEGEAGEAGAHMLDVGLDSTGHIAAFFGLIGTKQAKKRAAPSKTKPKRAPQPAKPRAAEPRPTANLPARRQAQRLHREPDESANASAGSRQASGIKATIEKALRAAGLM